MKKFLKQMFSAILLCLMSSAIQAQNINPDQIRTPAFAPNQRIIYISPNCGAQTNCYPIKADGQFVTDAGFTAMSTTVTTGASDPPFVAGDVGKAEFGTYNCQGVSEASCTYNCPQGIITSFVNAHTITVSIACIHTSSATANSNNFIWGSDDATSLGTAVTALMAHENTTPTMLQLPCGVILMGAPKFELETYRVTPHHNSVGIQGCGTGNPTVIVPLPKMNCINGTATNGCLLSDDYNQDELGNVSMQDSFSDILFWGGGTDVPDSSATYTNGISGIYLPFFATAKNVWVEGWVWDRAVGSITYGFTNIGGSMFGSGSYAGGNYACQMAGIANVPANAHGGTCGGSEWNSIVMSAGAGGVSTYGIYINAGLNAAFGTKQAYGVYNAASTWRDYGSEIDFGLYNESGGISKLSGSKLNGLGTLYDFVITGGSLSLSNITMLDNAIQTGGTLINLGGNTGPLTGFTQSGGTSSSVSTETQAGLCSTNTATITFNLTYINAPLVTVSGTTSGSTGAQATSISKTAATIHCNGASDTFTAIVTPNPF